MAIKGSFAILIALLTFPIGAHAALHFGIGLANYDDEYIHYTDKGYYENFSTDLGLYSDFDKSHMVYIDVHRYLTLSSSNAVIRPILYAGLGGIFVQDISTSSHMYEESWGIRAPIGIEFMTQAFSLYTEIVPTLMLSPKNQYETIATFGFRYYLY